MLNTSAISTAEARFVNRARPSTGTEENQAGLRLWWIGRLYRPDLP